MSYVRMHSLCALLLLATAACGGGGSLVPTLVGPTVIDFETRPDVFGFNTFPVPQAIATGVWVDAAPGTDMYDVNSNDGWGTGCPSALAFSGDLFIGASGNATASFTIEFDAPVSRASLYVGDDTNGNGLRVDFLDQAGGTIVFTTATADCPSLDANDLFDYDHGSNGIYAIRVTGVVPFVDDVRYWRYE